MNQNQIVSLLDRTFNAAFDVETYAGFLKELLNEPRIHIQPKTRDVPGQFREYVAQLTKVGEYVDPEQESIELLAVKVNRHSSVERARTMQRNFVANWLNKRETFTAAIVAFYDDEEADWRFSFVKLEYQLAEDEEGVLKTEKVLTSAKRYSFLVGPTEPNHTCRKQFQDLLEESDRNPLISQIEEAFGIERVTNEFFKRYREHFLQIKESLDRIIKRDGSIRDEFVRVSSEQDLDGYVVEFSKKLLGQIVFLYFLQKKRWLGIERDENGKWKEWGTGPKDFMRQLFKGKYVHYENFFNEVLEPLFYHTLAIKRENDYSEFKCKIPFLNGGLFEPLDGYNWQETQIEIENEVFADLFDTFDEFNFTVKEDEPLDREVAVDPEMLGKVFENLLEVTDRKSAGAFYTPREIVHYMCQQSLINYLDERSSAPREDIRRFIEEGEVLLDQTIRDQEHKKTYSGKSWAEQEQLIPRSIAEFYEEIDELLRTIKVVDPAVGSGAFPIGMLNEIVRARSILSIYFERERNTAELKRECIENSLYGVDIMPSAVDICQLRFWLSLVVDELDRNDVHPLPNLDHKIKCGNSLLQEFEGVKLFDESLLGASTRRSTLERLSELQEQEQALAKQSVEGQISKEEYDRRSREIRKVHREIMRLARSENHSKQTTIEQAQNVKISRSIEMLREYKQLQRLFFREHDRENKRRLSNQIEELEWELIEETLGERDEDTSLQKLREIKKSKSKPFLLWKLYFSEVFQRQEPGFDIVIANPPYVSAWYMEKNNPGERDALRTQYADLGILKGHWDLYVAFIGLGYNILRPKGTLAYIVPSPLLKEKYAIEVRRFLLERTRLESLLPFAESNVFEGVSRRTVVFTAVKEVTNDDYQISVRNADIDRVDVVSEVRCANKSGWIADKRCVYMVTGDTETARLARKLDEVGSKLGNYFYVNIGAQLYSKKKGLFKRGHLIHHQKSAGRKPFFEGRDLQRWMIKSKDLWLDYRYNEIYGPRDPQLFETQKIVIRQITDRGHKLAAAVDSQGLYCDQSVLVAVPYRSLHGSNLRLAFKGYDHETDVPHLYYALAFLHSKVCTFYFRKRFSDDSLQGATSHAYPKSIRALPLPRASRALEAEIVRLAQLAESETVKGNLRGADRVAEELDSVFFEICEFNRQEINTILSYCQDPVS